MEPRELEALSSEELHHRAVNRAVRHMDAGFLWRLIKAVPAAEAASGHLREAELDIISLRARVNDTLLTGQGELADALRPLYIDYLVKHS
jgi:hypothetical protein